MSQRLDKVLVAVYALLVALPLAGRALHLPDREIEAEDEPAVPSARWPDVLTSDDARTGWSRRFDTALGFRGVAITVHGTLLYHLFGETKPESPVVVGKDDFLFPKRDIGYEFWQRDSLDDAERLDAIAEGIARVQTALSERQRALVPLIVPPKTALWGDKVPSSWRMASATLTQEPAVYRAIRDALDRRGVRYVDVRRYFGQSKEPREWLWGPHARHWSAYGACLVMGEVLATYATLTHRVVPPYPCEVDRDPHLHLSADEDMADVANILWFPPTTPRTPGVKYRAPEPGSNPTVLFVATSFGWELIRTAYDSRRFDDPLLDYYGREFVRWPTFERRDAAAGNPEWKRLVGGRDLYVLDLFETILEEKGGYIQAFLDAYLASFPEG